MVFRRVAKTAIVSPPVNSSSSSSSSSSSPLSYVKDHNMPCRLLSFWNVACLTIISLAILHQASHIPLTISTNDENNYWSLKRGEPYHYKLNPFYSYSRMERYTIEHAVQLKYSRNVIDAVVADVDDPSLSSISDQQHWEPAHGCNLWKPSTRTIYEGFIKDFLPEMEWYNQLLHQHPGSPVLDLRQRQRKHPVTPIHDDIDITNTTIAEQQQEKEEKDICESLQVHRHGLGGVFTTGSLARSPHGLLEPIYPPFGSLTQTCPRLFHDAGVGAGSSTTTITTRSAAAAATTTTSTTTTTTATTSSNALDFLVHDFTSHCQRVQSTSKIILIDVGYDVLDKWQPTTTTTNNNIKKHNNKKKPSKQHQLHPTQMLLKLYQKFGFPVDQIYVFDTSKTPQNTNDWISQIVRIDGWFQSKPSFFDFMFQQNSYPSNQPWNWILSSTSPEDLVLVTVHFPPRGQDPTKEMELIRELLPSSSSSSSLESSQVIARIDGLYFHPLVYMAEDEPSTSTTASLGWKKYVPFTQSSQQKQQQQQPSPRAVEQTIGKNSIYTTPRWSIQEAMQLFSRLREHGIMAHAWVA